MERETLTLSPLGHTWILDLDGTLVKHNGYKLDGHDSWLEGALDFLKNIPEGDLTLFVTSRPPELKEMTERFLREHGVRYDRVIYGAPYGERILINDRKPSGLNTALAVNPARDAGPGLVIAVDHNL